MDLSWLSDVLQFLVDLLLWIPRKVWELLLEGLGLLISAIPVPAFISELAGAASAIPASVTWWLDLFQINQGFAIIGTAYALRFIIRRLPVIG